MEVCDDHESLAAAAESPPSKSVITWKCFSCPIIFTDYKAFTHHMETATEECKPYACPTCDMTFTSAQFLEDHNAEHHKSFPCPVCKEMFVGVDNYIGEEILFFSCQIAKKLFCDDKLKKIPLSFGVVFTPVIK